MRSKIILAAATAAMALGLAAPMPAEAFEDYKYRVGQPEDPYVYVPRLPRYYPYYNSGYWVPAEGRRKAFRNHSPLPPYYQAWGYNTRKWYLAHKVERRRDWHR